MHGRCARAAVPGLMLVAAGLGTPLARVAGAQSTPAVTITAAPAGTRTTTGPSVSIHNLFNDARSADMLASGIPATVTTTVELWASRRLFDNLLSATSVRRIVRYEALSQTYRIGRVVEDSVVEEARAQSLAEVRTLISATTVVPLLAPPGHRALYYTAHVTIETLNSDDLVELQRWLQGEVRPAIRGEKNLGSPITRGLRTIISRLLGGDVKRFHGRSELFET